MKPRLEVCIDSADGIAACVAGGADRIELCSALSLGGLTPSTGLMRLAAACPMPVRAMIRPVAGGFLFSEADVAQMLADIDAVREAGLEGVVLGAATEDGDLDTTALRALCNRADGMGRTLHRVVDLLPDPGEAIDTAAALGFDCILSSGGAMRAVDGTAQLASMTARAAGRLAIMPGSGITAENVGRIVAATGAEWMHASCSCPASVDPGPRARGFMSGQETVTDRQRIHNMVRALAQGGSRP